MDNAAKDAAGRPDAVKEVVERVHKTMDKVERMAGESSTGNRNTATVRIEAGGLAVWIVTLIAGAIFALYWDNRDDSRNAMSEIAGQLRELREKDEIHDAWLQTLNNNKQDKQK